MDNNEVRGFVKQTLVNLQKDEIISNIPESEQDLLPNEVVNDPNNDDAEIDDSFDFQGFQIVRREFFAHISEPSVTLSFGKVGFNMACLRKMPNVDYIQYLIDPDAKILGIRPCHENAKDSVSWSSVQKGKKKPRQISGKSFFIKLVNLMEWNLKYRYKVIGRFVKAQGQYLLVFDLKAAEVYRTIENNSENEQKKFSRVPVFPSEWENKFGVPYYEHRQSLEISTFDNFAVISVNDKNDISPGNIKSLTSLDTSNYTVDSPLQCIHLPQGGELTT